MRDALYGGCPSDIDIWLPSNINIPDIDDFIGRMAVAGMSARNGWEVRPLFIGPGARRQGADTLREELGGVTEDYRDVSNRWVIEIEHPEWPRINFMRLMTEWTGDAPAFFTSLMRNFDLDICMFFIGMMPGQHSTRALILPEHIRDIWLNPTRLTVPQRHSLITPLLNQVYWNQLRLDTTSADRVLGRIRKINSKYMCRIPEDPASIQTIATEDINATVVDMRDIITPIFNCDGGYGRAALPTRDNRYTEAERQDSFTRATTRFEQYIQQYGIAMAQQQGLTVRSFINYDVSA